MKPVYAYVGPAELLDQVRPGAEGVPILAAADEERLSGDEPFTYVVDADLVLT